MSWLRRSRPAYEVDGVEPHRNDEGRDLYDGETLAGRPAVIEALERLPQDPALEYLPYSLGLGTQDGREWALTLGDEALIWFGLSHPGGSDIFEETLSAAPFTDSVERVDREAFVITTTEVLAADLMLAHCLDVCGKVFRRLHDSSTD